MRRSRKQNSAKQKRPGAGKVVTVLASGTIIGFGALLAPKASASPSFDDLLQILNGGPAPQGQIAQDCVDCSLDLPCNHCTNQWIPADNPGCSHDTNCNDCAFCPGNCPNCATGVQG